MLMSAWEKRLRTPTLRAIAQNQTLGAQYFRFEALSGPTGHGVAERPLPEALDVLEELANRARCVVALPEQARLALYFVESDSGRSRVVWYEPRRRLVAAAAGPSRWQVSLDVDGAQQPRGQSTDPVETAQGMRRTT
jgi:hypothetical protein